MKYTRFANAAIILILSFIITGFSSAQIETVIDDFSPEYGQSPNIGGRPFLGRFEFTNLPEPLKPTRVNFTLNCVGYPGPDRNQDWLIKIHYSDDVCHIIGDTTFHWNGTHRKGETFEGFFEFVPLMSGQWGIGLSIYGIDGGRGVPSESGLFIEWCFDEDGQLLYLGKVMRSSKKHWPIRNYFFDEDSVVMKNSSQGYGFKYRIIVSPIPRIGDTTTIKFLLTANTDIPNGCELIVEPSSMEIVSELDHIGYAIFEGQTIEYLIRAVPLAVMGEHRVTISYQFISADGIPNGSAVSCCMVFDEEGGLKYINDTTFDFAPKEIFPTNYPKQTRDQRKSIFLSSDGRKVIK